MIFKSLESIREKVKAREDLCREYKYLGWPNTQDFQKEGKKNTEKGSGKRKDDLRIVFTSSACSMTRIWGTGDAS
jgi:hypothetical protein